MNTAKTILAAAVAATASSMPAVAQEAGSRLPDQCTASTSTGGMDASPKGADGIHGEGHPGAGSAMTETMGMGGMDLDTMPEHVQETMRRMMISMLAMHEGMMKEDADVAFACGMLAHHQGAIDMAQVLLDYGNDPQMIEFAGKIIAAQVGEMEEMTTWLAENAN